MTSVVSKNVRFDKGMTAIIKGFAIIFMMLLHCYGSDNYDVVLDYSRSLFTGESDMFKICVGMFTFMVGYGYAFSRDKDFKYSWRHIMKLLITFWTILFLLTLPFCFKEVAHTDASILFYNLFGINSRFNYYSWFVYFFIFAMIVMPVVSRFIDRKPVRNTAIVVVICVLLSVLVHEIPRFMSWIGIQMPAIVDIDPLMALFNSLMMMSPTVLGYLFAKGGYYERINIGKLSGVWTVLLCGIAFVVALVLRHYFYPLNIPFQFDFFYAPLMIGAIVIFFNKFNCGPVRTALMKIGEVSVYMWFFHALFYVKAVRWFYQPAITIFNDINLVVLWAIVLTFFASWLIKSVVDRVIKLVSSPTSSI